MGTIGSIAVSLVLAIAAAPEDGARPDFSGTWQLNQEKSRLELAAPSKSIFVIEHQEPRFKLTRTHTWGERSDTLSFEYTTDGEEHHRKQGNYESWARMSWLGDELVLDMRMSYKGEEGTNVVHYRLADEGQTFIAAEWYHMASKIRHNLWVLDRLSEE